MAFFKQNFIDGVTVVQAAWLNGIQEVVGAGAVAPEYNSEQTYAAGTLVSHDAKLYRNPNAIVTPEEWTLSHWQAVSLEGLLAEKEDVSDAGKIFYVTGGVTTASQIDAAIDEGAWPILKENGVFLSLVGKLYGSIGGQSVTRYPFECVDASGTVFYRELQYMNSTNTWKTFTSAHLLATMDDIVAITNEEIDALYG